MLAKATTLEVDTVCMDLEDAVAPESKVVARTNIVQALNAWKQHTKTERLVRINTVVSPPTHSCARSSQTGSG